MIRINLLAVERKAAVSRVELADKALMGCSILMIATVAVLGWRFWSIRQEASRLGTDLAAARVETEQLQTVLQQVAEFEAQRAQLQQRVALIEDLRRGQSAPVHLLDELSRALPDRLWLTQMRQENADLRVEGRTTSLTALSDFVGNLESSGYFTRPVEILDSQVETQRGPQGGAGPDVVTFIVRAQFNMPGSQAPGEDTPGAAAVPSLPAGE